MSRTYFVSVDVGTGSVRGALVNLQGHVVNQYEKPIKIWKENDFYEQSSDDIWESLCYCVKKVVANINSHEVAGISFDATCSLVVLTNNGQPLSISRDDNPQQNIILWKDHRAWKEAELINDTKHKLLNYVGGKVSLEMEMPKLLWLKRNLNLSCWSKIWKVFDLADFLTWKSTGYDTRSLCTVTCKWNYDAENMSWSKEFLDQINMPELYSNNFFIIGKDVVSPGHAIGKGLTKEAAYQLGLTEGTTVGAALIDAHAGALGVFGCHINRPIDIENKLALICGTSTCHISLTKEPCWVNGIWGPYKNVVLSEFYLNEGGQSVAGALLDHILTNHPEFNKFAKETNGKKQFYNFLDNVLYDLAKQKNYDDVCYLTKDLHVWPDFHGNRSPIADPNLKGMICGLTLSNSTENLAILYLACLQALSYGTRHIIESLIENGHSKFEALIFCGGLAKNALYVETHANACNIPSIIPEEKEMVLVGTAMLAARAAEVYPSLKEASMAMGGTGKIFEPKPKAVKYHNKKYKIFLTMLKHQKMYKNIMDETEL